MPGKKKRIIPPKEKKETVEEIRCRCPYKARTYTQVLKEGHPTIFEQRLWPELVLEWNEHFKSFSRAKKRQIGSEYIAAHSVTYSGQLLQAEASDEYYKLLPLIHGAPF